MILYLEERSHAEIAEILGITETNTATRISRVKDKLKQRFSQLKSKSHGRHHIDQSLEAAG